MDECKLDSRVGRAFYGPFRRLTTVQQFAEQPLLGGLDVIILSGTGSGKTAAVLAPLVQRHLLTGPKDDQATIVYVVPTKALGNDVVKRISAPIEALGFSVGLRHGDAPAPRHAHRADIAVITPESLDVLVSGNSHVLRGVRAMVIDEAHLFYNTQRGLQLSILTRRIEARASSPLQVVGLSATIGSPKYLWNFFRPHVDEANLAIVTGDAGRPIEVAVRIERVEGDLGVMLERVARRQHFKVLAFVNSRRVADRLAEQLQQSSAFKDAVLVHHSSISGDHRERTEREFAARARVICVATSTLELGIDIGDVDLVVLYGLSGGWESFLQRIGRGNRRGDRAKVLCISPHDNSYNWLTTLLYFAALRIARTGEVDPTKPLRLHGAVVQQVFSILRERSGGYLRLADIAQVLAPWHHLTRSTVDAIADALVEGGFCLRHGFQNRIGAGNRLHELEALRLLWGNFPARSREIPLRARGTEIGSVSVSNLPRLSPGRRIRFGGRVWRVASVRSSAVEVVPAQGRSADTEIGYLGKGAGVDPALLEMARQMLVNRTWKLDDLARTDAEEFQNKLQALSDSLSDTELPFAHENGTYCYLTFAGSLINDVVCRWKELDHYEIDDVCIWSPRPIDFLEIPNDPEHLVDHAAESLKEANELTIFQSMLPTSLLCRELVEPWCRVPYYAQILQRLAESTPKRIESEALQNLLR